MKTSSVEKARAVVLSLTPDAMPKAAKYKGRPDAAGAMERDVLLFKARQAFDRLVSAIRGEMAEFVFGRDGLTVSTARGLFKIRPLALDVDAEQVADVPAPVAKPVRLQTPPHVVATWAAGPAVQSAKPAPVAAPAKPAPAPVAHASTAKRPPDAVQHRPQVSPAALALVETLRRIGRPANKAQMVAAGVDRSTWSAALSEAYRARLVRRAADRADVLHKLA